MLWFLIVSPPDRMVASYLVHHSYCATAEAFAKSTDQAVQEELASIKNRQSEFLMNKEKIPDVMVSSVAQTWGTFCPHCLQMKEVG